MFPHVIEADHCKNRGKKIHNCGDVRAFWCRKPIKHFKIELQKCIPLCIMCHRKKTQEVNTIRKMLDVSKKKQKKQQIRRGKAFIYSHKIGKNAHGVRENAQ